MTRYWFKPKRYGYGSTPSTWEGWLFTFAILIAAIACAELARRYATTDLLDFKKAAPFWFAVMSGVVVVVGGAYVSYLKTEGGWRWRGPK